MPSWFDLGRQVRDVAPDEPRWLTHLTDDNRVLFVPRARRHRVVLGDAQNEKAVFRLPIRVVRNALPAKVEIAGTLYVGGQALGTPKVLLRGKMRRARVERGDVGPAALMVLEEQSIKR